MVDHGKPPKSSNSIRSQLEKIHATANVVRHRGPMTEEKIRRRQVVVASFFDHRIGKMFREELKQKGLFPESVVKERKMVVSVDNTDVKIASRIAKTFREKYPDKRPVNDASRFDGLLFGSVIGFKVGVVFVVGSANDANAREFALAMFGCGMAAGHLVDRSRSATARGEKMLFGVWELLIVVALLAISIVAIRDFAALIM